MHINQIDLIAAISSEIEKQIPGIPAEPRYMNAIIKAANLVCDEFKKPFVKASEGMGLAAWLASDYVGASSKYMASVLSGQFSAPHHYPLDGTSFQEKLLFVVMTTIYITANSRAGEKKQRQQQQMDTQVL
ncbi:hypothetical protein VKM53_11010 [Providencia stuartii]|uniref:hypothetical protein n=1 Tax=Providencia stuartii TaxID=588 RepID=UPI0024AC500F|nr:hypothetical protein [Providencia stuartii]MCB5218877.1 hypothetical protein [Providencia stuartii]MEB3132914.1 hypothetical protein [Providencia stuartii]